MDYTKYLKKIENNGVDFICTDPPYEKINEIILMPIKKTKITKNTIYISTIKKLYKI